MSADRALAKLVPDVLDASDDPGLQRVLREVEIASLETLRYTASLTDSQTADGDGLCGYTGNFHKIETTLRGTLACVLCGVET